MERACFVSGASAFWHPAPCLCLLTPLLCCSSVWHEGGTSVGDTEEPTGDELRQAQPIAALLLREGNHAKGKKTENI